VIVPGNGRQPNKEVRTFGMMTADLLELADWLGACQVTHVAMESTGVYWKPLWNLLEGQVELLLVNAHHVKQVPGRKTDVNLASGWPICSATGCCELASCQIAPSASCAS
jgi:transposase